MRAIDIPAGTRFGRLTVVAEGRTRAGRRAMTCVCACGQEKVVSTGHLRSGHTTSCGCLHRELAAELARTNPLIAEYRASDLRREQSRARSTTHGLSYHAHRVRWRNMMDRCHDPENPAFHRYGGRGIKVCPEWHDLAAFCAWIDANLGPCPDGMSLDRKDNNGNYEPGNVRWMTWAGQIRNSSSAKITMDIAEEIRRRYATGDRQGDLAAEFGVSRPNISLIVTGKAWKVR